MILKTNLHLHTSDDPLDKISYSTFEMIDHAKAKNFDVLAITCHTKVVQRKEYADYAFQKKILLISGIEAKIEDRDVVILNCGKEAENLKTFRDLTIYKNKNPRIFVLAPHPFVPTGKSLYQKLENNIGLFDAIEQSVFSNRFFNFNKKAEATAKKHNKLFIATSDTHRLKDLDRNFVLIELSETRPPTNSEIVSPKDIFEALKKGNFQNKADGMGISAMTEFTLRRILRKII